MTDIAGNTECVLPPISQIFNKHFETTLSTPKPIMKQDKFYFKERMSSVRFVQYNPNHKRNVYSHYNSNFSLFNTLEGKWTPDEEKMLTEGIILYGRQWTKISTEKVQTRSASACVKRAKLLNLID